MNKIILASASPRRRELLAQIGYTFEVCPSTCEEHINGTSPVKVVEELSLQKAWDVYDKLRYKKDTIVLGADTIVACGEEILGKPGSKEEACRMLSMLQDGTHQVYTGVTLCYEREERKETVTFYECTDVTFYPMTQEEIGSYIEDGEPMDKAGAYGIQGKGAAFVKAIVGDYNNVVGLPLARLYQEIKKL